VVTRCVPQIGGWWVIAWVELVDSLWNADPTAGGGERKSGAACTLLILDAYVSGLPLGVFI
jgi:hypothetical protein